MDISAGKNFSAAPSKWKLSPQGTFYGEIEKMSKKLTQRLTLFALAACVALGCFGSIGCQTTRNGQTLPSPYYLKDDIQYFPAGPEFPLSKEAAQMERNEAEYLKASQNRY